MGISSSGTARQHRAADPAHAVWQLPEAGALVVHALAQVPDAVTVQLPRKVASRSATELLARAYGVEDRLSFGSAVAARSNFARLVAGEATFAEAVEGLAGDERLTTAVRGDDDVFRGHRIGLVTNFPAHYRVPLFNAVASRLDAAGARLTVLFCAHATRSRPWLEGSESLNVDHAFLRSLAPPLRSRPPLVPIGLASALARARPTMLLSAGFSPAVSGRVASYARRARVPFGIWSGEHEGMKSAHNPLRTAQRRHLLARADFAIAYGSAAARYLRTVAPTLPTVIGRNTAPLPDPTQAANASNRSVEIVAIGDLADQRKGIDVAIDALHAHPELNCRLTVIGGGSKSSALETRSSSDRRIELAGARSPVQTREALAGADVFVFPTRADVFGLAVVEAMGAGVCTLVSSAAGAVHDLCADWVNCLVIRGHDRERWADAFAEVASDPRFRRELAARARLTIARRWTLEHAADAMVAGLRLGILTGARG
jgi:glycosyltransferase involved in cell wall biosynthesis